MLNNRPTFRPHSTNDQITSAISLLFYFSYLEPFISYQLFIFEQILERSDDKKGILMNVTFNNFTFPFPCRFQLCKCLPKTRLYLKIKCIHISEKNTHGKTNICNVGKIDHTTQIISLLLTISHGLSMKNVVCAERDIFHRHDEWLFRSFQLRMTNSYLTSITTISTYWHMS